MKIQLIILLILVSIPGVAQSDTWNKWDPEVLNRANTAADFEYYTEEEKKVVVFMNLVRMEPQLFAETVLSAYVEANNVPSNSYLKSLNKTLKKLDPMGPLYPEEDLTSIAQGHAVKSGETGHVGHKDFNKRFEPFMRNPYYGVAENCSYGYPAAIDIVITLLIDDGVKNLGHRNNTLNPEFNSVGVAIREHKKYRYNGVIDFGKQSRSNLNDGPF
ncbi:MAG: CAP domain-containing protein [Bacteroidales bacterium]